MFLCIVPTWMFDIFILDVAGMKIHLAGIKTRSQRKNGLPSSYVAVCNFQYGDSGNENLFRRKNVSVGLQRGFQKLKENNLAFSDGFLN